MAKQLQPLPGFRDFVPRDCAIRNYILETWRRVSLRHGFVEYETPVVEETEVYLKKSGGEIGTQLFRFEDQGGRDITLRPEVTPSMARLVASTQSRAPMPLKWFEIGQCFRYEKPQKGRLREFYQYNADLLGSDSPAADAELMALAIGMMKELGFEKGDFVLRLSDREVWTRFATEKGINSDQLEEFLSLVDKVERMPEEKMKTLLSKFSLTSEDLKTYMADQGNASEALQVIYADLEARGLGDFVQYDFSIVRGLAYYTGPVFEIFDLKHNLRAIAGGGRYDNLVSTMSDGSVDLPAVGFGMGDVVLRHLIEETGSALMQMEGWLRQNEGCDLFMVISDEEKRPAALKLATQLREAGLKTDLPLTSAKLGKQFQKAEKSGARIAVVVGSDFPELTVKMLNSRTEETIYANTNPVTYLQKRLNEPDGPLLA